MVLDDKLKLVWKLRVPGSKVEALRFLGHPPRQFLFAQSERGVVLWFLETGKRKELTAVDDFVINDNETSMITTRGGQITVREISSGKPTTSTESGSNALKHLALSADGSVFAAYTRHAVEVWTVPALRHVGRFPTSSSFFNRGPSIQNLALSVDGALLAVGFNHSVRVYNLAQGPRGHALERVWGNFRVCRSTKSVKPVFPLPPTDSIWAPEALCER